MTTQPTSITAPTLTLQGNLQPQLFTVNELNIALVPYLALIKAQHNVEVLFTSYEGDKLLLSINVLFIDPETERSVNMSWTDIALQTLNHASITVLDLVLEVIEDYYQNPEPEELYIDDDVM